MSYPNTTTTPLFIEHQPDWQQGVRFFLACDTNILIAKAGAEQRTAKREKPLYAISYTREYEKGGWGVRRAQIKAQMQSAVVVPIWTRPKEYVSISTNTVTLDVTSLAQTPFKVGSYAYFEEAGKTSVFRQITAVGTTTITLASGNAAYPDISPPSYTSAALVYPCIVGAFQDSRSNWTSRQHNQAGEQVYVTEL